MYNGLKKNFQLRVKDMAAVRVQVTIGDDRKLNIQLPKEIPPGEIELIVRTVETTPSSSQNTREAARAKLLTANALVTLFDVPDNAVRLTVEERIRLGTLPENAPSSLDLINDDRGML